MHYHLILTEKCNSQCRYCYEKSLNEFENSLEEKFEFDYSAPCSSEIDLNELKNFLLKDSNPVLIFYGGEPLLEIDKLKAIVDFLEDTNVKFRMQTNGKLLDRMPVEYLNKIDKILVSIDGDKEKNDFNRGDGTYDLVLKNLNLIRSLGYSGEIVARMTISQNFPEIFEQVKHLVILNLFDSIHWQLDVGFYKCDFEENKIRNFFDRYNKSVLDLINWWIENIKKGEVYRLYPFIAIVNSLLRNEKTSLRCGAGHSGYAITTNGKIVACPIMNSIKNFEAGDLNSSPSELKKFDILECDECDVKYLCGGRCLYWRKAKLWPKDGDKLICDSIKFYIREIEKKISIIKEEIKKGNIKKEDFEYEKYFGPEIIP